MRPSTFPRMEWGREMWRETRGMGVSSTSREGERRVEGGKALRVIERVWIWERERREFIRDSGGEFCEVAK